MVRSDEFDLEHQEPGSLEQGFAVLVVKNVVMKTTSFKIAETSLSKLLKVSCCGIAGQVVILEHIIKMRLIRFVDTAVEIFHHVIHRCWAASMIKRVSIIREHHNERASGPGDTDPFLQRFQRIGSVLQIMGRKDEIVSLVRNAA